MSGRFLALKGSLLSFAAGFSVSVQMLSAAPDPDLFDGRITSPPPVSSSEVSGSNGADGADGAVEQSAGVGAEEVSSPARDLSEIEGVRAGEVVGSDRSNVGAPSESSNSHRDFGDVGQVGGGKSVGSASSKSGATAPSRAGGAGGGTPDAGADGGGGSTGGGGVPIEKAVTGGGGSGSSSASTERNFEDFGFGATGGTNSTVEVHETKRASVPSSPGGRAGTVPPEASTPNSGSGAGGSQPAVGSGSGDYGSNLPSGL